MDTYSQTRVRVLYCVVFAAFVYAMAFPSKSFAAACTGLPTIGSRILSNCELTVAAVTGVDQANNIELSTTNAAVLTLNAGASVTINSGGTLAVGSINLSGGTIAIDSGGATKPNTPIYVVDADADGWADSFSTIVVSTESGKRRLSLMRSDTATDCNGDAFSTTNTCLIANGGACSADDVCVSGICGTNADGDSYFSLAALHTGTCQASALPYTDCYDSNATAYPGSTTCSGTDRGDGSFDFNCSSSETTCGTIRNRSCSSTQLTNDYCSGVTCAANTVNGYLTTTTACGAVGCTCSTTLTRGTSCSAVGGLYPSCSIPTTASYCSAVTSAAQSCQ